MAAPLPWHAGAGLPLIHICPRATLTRSLSVESRVRMEAGDIHLDDEIEQHCDETGSDYPGGTGIAPTRSSTRVQRGGVDHPSDEGDVNDG